MGTCNAERDLIGKRVVSADGRDLGEIEDVQIDDAAWYVRGVLVRLHPSVRAELDAAATSPGPAVLVSSRQVHAVNDMVRLQPSIEDFARLALPHTSRET
jgi:sporulation protein YlmC with PRC-barrel domain